MKSMYRMIRTRKCRYTALQRQLYHAAGLGEVHQVTEPSSVFNSRMFVPLLAKSLHTDGNINLKSDVKADASEQVFRKLLTLSATNQPDFWKIENRPMVFLFNWLGAKEKHINKYRTLYHEHGCDVYSICIKPWQLLWPLRGSQPLTRRVGDFILSLPSTRPLLIHGFSVGGYVFSELLVHAIHDHRLKDALRSRIVGQIWDSLVDYQNIAIGFPKAVSPKSTLGQKALETYIRCHMKVFEQMATRHYRTGSREFHERPLLCPTLMFASRDDPVGDVVQIAELEKEWKHLGMQTFSKVWDRSKHVSHMHTHAKEYTDEVVRFMDRVGLISPRDPIAQMFEEEERKQKMATN